MQRLKTLLLQEEYNLLPANEPTCASLALACVRARCVFACASDVLLARSDVNIEAPPSIYPAKKYCDLTGQPARYTDPKSKLRYADAAAFEALRRLPPDTVQLYLGLRRAAVVLK